MTFDLNVSQIPDTSEKAYACLDSWCKTMPSLGCFSKESGLVLFKRYSPRPQDIVAKVDDIFINHVYTERHNPTFNRSLNIDRSREWKLEVYGKDTIGEKFVFQAWIKTYTTDGGTTWNGPYKHCSFLPLSKL